MKTFADYINLAEDAVEGDLPAAIDPKDIVNEALDWLTDVHAWKFLQRPSYEVGVTGDRDEIDLPPDIGRLLHVVMTNALTTNVIVTSLQTVQQKRSNQVTEALVFYVAIQFPTQTFTDQPAPNPTLAVYPSFTASAVDRLRILYRARIPRLTYMKQVPALPFGKWDTMLSTAVRQLARGYMAKQASPLDALDRLGKSGYLIDVLKASDGDTQWDLGYLHGGAVDESDGLGIYRPFTEITRASEGTPSA